MMPYKFANILITWDSSHVVENLMTLDNIGESPHD